MGHWHVYKPEETTNLFKNAIFSGGLSQWVVTSSNGASASIVTTNQFIGTQCVQIDALDSVNNFCNVFQGIASATGTCTLQAIVQRAAGGVLTNSQAQAAFGTTGSGTNWDSITYIRDGWYLCVKTGTAGGSLNFGVRALEVGLLIGAMQFEIKSYPTTLAYGSKKGNLKRGYYWTGESHLSTSVRDSQERTGGRVISLSDYIVVKKAMGAGVPAPNINRQKPAQQDGTISGGAYYNERTLQLTAIVSATTDPDDLDEYLLKKQNLWALFGRDIVIPEQPFVLRYTGSSKWLESSFQYEAGLEGLFDSEMQHNENLALRLFATDPFWYELGNNAATLDVQDMLTTNYFVQRSTSGVWDDVFSTLDGAVRAMVKGPDGSLYLGGNMANPGAYAVQWDGSTLAAMDSGPAGIVHSLIVDGSNILAAGESDTIEEWGGSSWASLVANLAANGPIYAVHTDGTTVWFGGDFSQIGGIGANNIAAYTISGGTWAALGTGTNGPVYAIHKNGTNLYVGGSFTAAGGVSNTKGIARYDLSSPSWNAMGTGISQTYGTPTVYGIDADSSNNIYVVGNFDQMGGISQTRAIAKWNGSVWSSMGNFAYGSLLCIEIDSSNNIYVGGPGTYIGASGYLFKWGGASWALLTGGDVNGTVYTLYHDGTLLWIGGAFTQAGAISSTARFCSHNGTTYAAKGSGIDNGIVYSIAPNGTSRIVGGSFLNADGQASGDYVIEWDGAAYQVMSTGLAGIVRAIATVSTDNYIGGEFLGGAEGDYATLWDTSAFSDFDSTGTLAASDTIRAMVKTGGILYFAGDFVTVNSLTVNYITALDADLKPLLLGGATTGINGPARALTADTAGNVYLGGQFTTAGGTTVNYVAKLDPSTLTFSALGSGVSFPVFCLTIDPATGYLWAGGDNGLLAYFDGVAWTELDTDANGAIYSLAIDDDGFVHIGGDFTSFAGLEIDGYIRYINGIFIPVEVDLPSAATVYSILADGVEISLGFNTAGVTLIPGSATVTNSGKALAKPIFVINGPGTIRQIINATTKKRIYFNNLTLVSGEEVELDLTGFNKKLTSSLRGNISGRILQSDADTFALKNGSNSIQLFSTDSTATATIQWRAAYEDVAGVAA